MIKFIKILLLVVGIFCYFMNDNEDERSIKVLSDSTIFEEAGGFSFLGGLETINWIYKYKSKLDNCTRGHIEKQF